VTALDPYFKAIGRVLLTLIFLWSVIGKIFSYAGVQGYMAKFGVPGELLPLGWPEGFLCWRLPGQERCPWMSADPNPLHCTVHNLNPA